MNQLAGKVALITGAGQGVGQGIALAMAAAGASVVVAGRTLEKVQETAAEIARRGGEALAVACDVKSTGRVRQGGVISAVAVGHRQAALAVMCRG